MVSGITKAAVLVLKRDLVELEMYSYKAAVLQ